MSETVLNYQPLAPAINPVPPNDHRRARVAGSPPRRLSPTAGAMASGTRPRPPVECIALLLQAPWTFRSPFRKSERLNGCDKKNAFIKCLLFAHTQNQKPES